MTESCGCPPEAGNASCELPVLDSRRRPRAAAGACPVCGRSGKAVEGQTVKALLSVSLRQVHDVQYFFCRTQDCPVVYFSAGGQTFTVDQVRESVYQKQPHAADVFVCYCFRHTVGNIRAASPEGRTAILDEINAGIDAGQCACDLRNPQGSCCLGNARSLIRKLEQATSMEQ